MVVGGGVEGKNRDKSQRSMILRKIKDKTVSLELVNNDDDVSDQVVCPMLTSHGHGVFSSLVSRPCYLLGVVRNTKIF